MFIASYLRSTPIPAESTRQRITKTPLVHPRGWFASKKSCLELKIITNLGAFLPHRNAPCNQCGSFVSDSKSLYLDTRCSFSKANVVVGSRSKTSSAGCFLFFLFCFKWSKAYSLVRARAVDFSIILQGYA